MKMKTFVVAICLVCFSQGYAQENKQEKASVVLEKAFSEAKKDHKNVFLIFHASWCGWCKRMDKNMANAAVKDYFKNNFVTTHLTVMESKGKKHLENPGAIDILKEHKADRGGIPFWIIYNSKGEVLEVSRNAKGQNLGCPASPEEVAVFKNILSKTSSMSSRDKKEVANIFTIKK